MSDEKKETPTASEPQDTAANEIVEEINEGTAKAAEKPNEKAKEDAPPEIGRASCRERV